MEPVNKLYPIRGFPDYYITKQGRVFSARRHLLRELKTYCNTSRYAAAAMLSDKGKWPRQSLHRVMLYVFVGPPPEGKPHVRHLDGNPFNNQLNNLKWGSEKDNWQDRQRHGRATMRGEENIKARLTAEKVKQIRHLLKMGATQGELALMFNVAKPTINHIHCGRTWKTYDK
jgi:DNA-binding XRE family transcriptional regulator